MPENLLYWILSTSTEKCIKYKQYFIYFLKLISAVTCLQEAHNYKTIWRVNFPYRISTKWFEKIRNYVPALHWRYSVDHDCNCSSVAHTHTRATVFAINSDIEFRENPIRSLVADTASQKDWHMEGHSFHRRRCFWFSTSRRVSEIKEHAA